MDKSNTHVKDNIMEKAKKAVNYHKRKFNCAQSVFTVFGQDFGISEDDCLKLSCAFVVEWEETESLRSSDRSPYGIGIEIWNGDK